MWTWLKRRWLRLKMKAANAGLYCPWCEEPLSMGRHRVCHYFEHQLRGQSGPERLDGCGYCDMPNA